MWVSKLGYSIIRTYTSPHRNRPISYTKTSRSFVFKMKRKVSIYLDYLLCFPNSVTIVIPATNVMTLATK
ncbi:hypothetical protein GCM10007140_23940 [Priestia taiwanensis]|uniref:Uncharacterized protein n=1 Tax=Priestia taiwanensis TaxID=1347902 RepID=A0A917EQW4_9BACI|nr:hypothetical protein GCM10007140_23940 [Priestia taiwanensis]